MARVKKASRVVREERAGKVEKVKHLYRSRTNKILCGVCGGIGEYMNVDPSIIRLLWIIGTVFTGVVVGVLAYIVACFVVPKEAE